MKDKLVKASENPNIVEFEDGTKLDFATVRKYINAKLTDQECFIFLQQCRLFGLNPFKREIYSIKYSDSDPATYVVGFEAYLRRAARIDRLAGWQAETVGDLKFPEEFKAVVTIHRKDWTTPFVHEVFYPEYVQIKKDYKTGVTGPTKFWSKMPKTMLKKVCISQAFRLCFPEEMGGMPYTSEEMPVDHEALPVAEVILDAAEIQKPVPVAKEETPVTITEMTHEEAKVTADDINARYHLGEDALGLFLEANKYGDDRIIAYLSSELLVDADKKFRMMDDNKNPEPMKKKHPGGRPRKNPAPDLTNPKVNPFEKQTTVPIKPMPVSNSIPDHVVQINNILVTLEKEFGRDSVEIVNGKTGILYRVKKLFGSDRKSVEELNTDEGEMILRGLRATLKKCEEDKAVMDLPTEEEIMNDKEGEY